MTYPEDTPSSAICMMEGCEWFGGSVCVRCGARLRCSCGQFVRADAIELHADTCPVVQAMDETCPICEGGFGSACAWHFA